MPSSDSSSYRLVGQYAILLLAFVHFVIFVIDIALLYSDDPVWHGAFSVAHEMPARGKHVYTRVVAPSIDAAHCGESAQYNASREWAHDQAGPHAAEHDVCLFRRVSVQQDVPADPRGMHVFSSGTPLFLLVTLQVMMASHLLWSAAPISFMFGGDYGKTSQAGSAMDLALAAILPLVWVVLSFASQKHLHVVYNNVLVAFAVAVFTIFIEVSWLWRDVAEAGYSRLPEHDKKANAKFPGANASAVAIIDVSGLLRDRGRGGGSTQVPILPNVDQPDGRFGLAEGAVFRLLKRSLLPIPRMILLSLLLPLFIAAGMFFEDASWRYEEVFYVTLFAFAVVALAAPMFSIVSCLAQVETAASNVDQHALNGLMYISLAFLVVMLIPLAGFSHYLAQLPRVWDFTGPTVALVAVQIYVAALLLTGVSVLANVPAWVMTITVELCSAVISVLALSLFVL